MSFQSRALRFVISKLPSPGFPDAWIAAGTDRAALSEVAAKMRRLDAQQPPKRVVKAWAEHQLMPIADHTGRTHNLHVFSNPAADDGTDARGVLLHIHGGGYVLGPTGVEWGFASKLAKRLGVDFAFWNYPKAPEHPCDATLSTTWTAWDKLVDRYPSDRIVVTGVSAGGGLTLALLQHLRNEGMAQPAAAVLSSPWIDLTVSTEGASDVQEDDVILDLDGLRHMGVVYAGERNLRDPEVSPLFGDQSGLAPMQIQIGTDEILGPEGRALAEAVVAVGGTADLVVDDEGQHCAAIIPTPEGRALTNAAVDFLDERLDGDRPPPQPKGLKPRDLDPVGAEFLGTAPYRNQLRQSLPVSADEAFASLIDEATWKAFLDIDVVWTSPKPYGVGTTRTVSNKMATIDEEFFRWEEGRAMGFRFTRANLPGITAFAEEWRIEPTDDGTSELVWSYAYAWKETKIAQVGQQAAKAFGKVFAAQGARSLPKLAAHLDQQSS